MSDPEIYRKTISGTLDFERETLRIMDDRKAITHLEIKTLNKFTFLHNRRPMQSVIRS